MSSESPQFDPHELMHQAMQADTSVPVEFGRRFDTELDPDQLEEAERGLQVLHFMSGIESVMNTDAMTGLPNRKAMEELGQKLIDRGETVDVAFIDFDRFKRVNDTFGHDVGDETIQTLARTLAGSVRVNEGEILGRIQGDELLWIRVHGQESDRRKGDDASFDGDDRRAGSDRRFQEPEKQAAGIANRFENAANQGLELLDELDARNGRETNHSELGVGVTIGVATSETGESFKDVMARADAAMLEAKQEKGADADRYE